MLGRVIKWSLFGLAVAVVAWLAMSTWRFSDEVRQELLTAFPSDSAVSIEVTAIGTSSAMFNKSDAALWPGTWGVEWDDGYGRIGEVLASDATSVERSFEADEGSLVPGIELTIDAPAYPGDPEVAHGIPFEGVLVPGPLGSYPAWAIDGETDAWIVFVHGRTMAGRREALRILPRLIEGGYSALVATYRNDPGAPSSEDELTTWGFDEWRDVEAAVTFARARGADHVVLLGVDAGGAAVTMFLRESMEARHVAGAILDSAALDLSAIEDQRYHKPGLDGLIADWGRALAAFRYSVEWSQLDQVSNADRFKHPILLLHGSGDEVVPIEVAEDFAAARPDLVTYARFEGARHGALWNHDAARYENVVLSFLEGVTPEEDSE